jgi:hypothetical protein
MSGSASGIGPLPVESAGRTAGYHTVMPISRFSRLASSNVNMRLPTGYGPRSESGRITGPGLACGNVAVAGGGVVTAGLQAMSASITKTDTKRAGTKQTCGIDALGFIMPSQKHMPMVGRINRRQRGAAQFLIERPGFAFPPYLLRHEFQLARTFWAIWRLSKFVYTLDFRHPQYSRF